ncbi:hypothetical protein BJX65DRAFT_315185 [Aspergillus insuetus]
MGVFTPETDESVKRWDPLAYLGTTFEDPHTLLHVMTLTDTIISGSRAVEYFTPGIIDAGSDWDFYIVGALPNINVMSRYLEKIGVAWQKDTEKTPRPAFVEYPGSFTVRRGILHSKGGNAKCVPIQLIWSADNTPMENVLRFHSSAVQCFISGLGAGALYYDLLMRGETYHWNGNERTKREDIPTYGKSSATLKYSRRGLEYIDYLFDGNPEINIVSVRGERNGYYVSFADYVMYINDEFKDFTKTQLSNIEWDEMSYTNTRAVATVLNKSHEPEWRKLMATAFASYIRDAMPAVLLAEISHTGIIGKRLSILERLVRRVGKITIAVSPSDDSSEST